jgi:hypothetical protein
MLVNLECGHSLSFLGDHGVQKPGQGEIDECPPRLRGEARQPNILGHVCSQGFDLVV